MNKGKKVSEVIAHRFKYWKKGEHIILNCATGSGKTYFVLNVLAGWCKQNRKNILYLCNRKELFNQVENSALKFGNYGTVTIKTYQSIQADPEEYLNKHYDYVVFDEAHYMINEGWNKFTDIISEELVKRYMKNSTMIFMSATGGKVFENLVKGQIVKKNNVFTIKPDYSYVDKLVFYHEDDYVNNLINSLGADEKLIYICSNKKRGYKLKLILGDSAHFMCSRYDRNYESEDPIKVKSLEPKLITFDKKVLIATTALDVGVDIYDKRIKHIVTDVSDLSAMQQVLGRKRLVDETDRCTFHIKDWSKKALSSIMNSYVAELTIANKYLYDREEFVDYISSKKRSHFTNKCFYDWIDPSGHIVKMFNNMYYLYLKYKVEELYVLKEGGFSNIASVFLGESIKKIEITKDLDYMEHRTELDLYLESLIGKKILKDQQQELIDFIDVRVDGKQQKSYSRLNEGLKMIELNYVIIPKKSDSVRYWTVDKFDC